MKTESWLVQVLRSPYVLLVMLVMALYAQFPHAQFVFYKLIPHVGAESERQANFYAMTVECLIAIFVIHNWNMFSYVFALVSIATNVAYYQLGGINMFEGKTDNLWVFYLFSIFLPVAIAALTHLFADALTQHKQAPVVFDLRKWVNGISRLRIGFVFDLARDKWFTHATSTQVVETSIEIPAQADNLFEVEVQAVETSEVTSEVTSAQVMSDKYELVTQALTGSPSGLLAGQLAKMTGIAQTTLLRNKNGTEVGWLIDLMQAGVLAQRVEGKSRFFHLVRGTSNG